MSTLRFSKSLTITRDSDQVLLVPARYSISTFTVKGLQAKFSLFYDVSLRRLCVRWVDATAPLYLASGHIKVEDPPHDTVIAVTGIVGRFPSAESGSLGEATYDKSFGFGLTFNVEVSLTTGTPPHVTLKRELDEERRDFEQQRAKFARTAASTSRFRTPSDVCLSFPRTGQQLWASQAFLFSASPYFETLLTSSFAKSAPSESSPSQKGEVAPYTFDESDAETDEAEKKRAPPQRESTDAPYRTITVTATSYSTHLAVLVWLQGRYISFAPLPSTLSGPSMALALRFVGHKPDLRFPPTVSPKSVYCLATFSTSTFSRSAPCETSPRNSLPTTPPVSFTHVATCHSAVRGVVVKYVVKSWKKLKVAKAMKEMEEKAASRQMPAAAGATAMLLAQRLMEKYGGSAA
ncbi:hypothetical protein JCM11641_003470 [Rhodosporidiobolus odoratus]